MTGFLTELKSNIKLILRNRASIFLIFLVPLFSTLLFKVSLNRNSSEYRNTKMNVAVFDSSSDLLSKNLIDVLKSSSLYSITERHEKLSLGRAEKEAVKLANTSINSAFVYIPSNFYSNLLEGKNDSKIIIFTIGTDERISILKTNVNIVLERFASYGKTAQGDKNRFEALMKSTERNKIEKVITNVSSEKRTLNNSEQNEVDNFGYLVAIMGIVLIFSGNFISAIFVEEKNNKVIKRILLGKSSMVSYAFVKGVLALILLLVQVLMILLGIKLFINLGFNMWYVAILIFGLGLAANSLSIALGASFGDLNTSNYIAFFAATLSSLLSGVYFPMDYAPKWMQNLSLFMPQKWVMKTIEQIILGNSSYILLFGVVVLAYMIFFLSLGFIGLKLNSSK